MSGHSISYTYVGGSWLSVEWTLDKAMKKDLPVELYLNNEVRKRATQNLGKENPRPRDQPGMRCARAGSCRVS